MINTASKPCAYEPNRTYDAAKRTIDVVVGSSLLVVLAIPLVLVAVVVRMTSRGAALFTQERVGVGGRNFRIYKFRTMVQASEQHGPLITASGDKRITPIGRILRKTKVDELPQLINVVRGDMSLVGPRPQVPRFVDRFPEEYRDTVLAVRPGITGPTQLRFRHEEEMLAGQPNREQYYIDVLLPVKCRLDAEYVQTKSISYDLLVVAQTGMIFLRGNVLRVGRGVANKAAHAVVTKRVAADEDKADLPA